MSIMWSSFVLKFLCLSLQVWRAELVLADFMLHKMFTSSEIDGVVALELGAGTGEVTDQ